MWPILLFALIFEFRTPTSDADGLVYTSMSRLEDLALIEKTLLDTLHEYIEAEKSKLEVIVKFAEQVKKVHASRTTNDTKELYNSPVEVYSLLKRFTYQWTYLGTHVQNDTSKDLLTKLDVHKPHFPTVKDDLYGSIAAIFLLQDTYNITAKDMARGEIPGSKVKIDVNADDCFEIGSFALHFSRYHRSRGWLNEALERAQRPSYSGYLDMAILLEHTARVEYTVGDLERALKLSIDVIKLDPNNTRVLDNVMRYRREIRTGTVKTYEQVRADEDKKLTDLYLKTRLNKLCREKSLTKRRRDTRFLKCRYITSNPLLVLKPGKEEVVLVKPRMVIFRDFLRDHDLDKIKGVARPHLKRSEAYNLNTGKLEAVAYRISESTWLHESASDAVKTLNKRAEAVTGLDVSTAEDLQVANYGLGGQYEEHHDHGYPDSPLFNHLNGNRIATLLVYLSSVHYGGGTAFIPLKTYARPGKGDALFWYNLKRSGVGDNSTYHAACPVLTGVKWVANKWFHSHGQEFRRPCLLNENL